MDELMIKLSAPRPWTIIMNEISYLSDTHYKKMPGMID